MIELYDKVMVSVKQIEQLEGSLILKIDSDYLNLICSKLPETHQKLWDHSKFEGDEWTAFLNFLETQHKTALRKKSIYRKNERYR